MLLSYLGKRTQTPSSSPDPFSCYKMQRGLNEKNCKCAQFFVSVEGFRPDLGSKLGSTVPL
jgi:hypothetical protein